MLYSTASLQSLCLIKVIQQLEHYPPDLLVQLPPTLRRLLLVNLPIVDICQLEKTCVFDGMNVQKVWDEVFEQQISRYFTSLENFPPFTLFGTKNALEEKRASSREKCLSIIANIILNRARPSGYFAALRNYGGDYCEKPPSDILSDAPADIVNCLVAGDRLDAVNILKEECDFDSDSEVHDDDTIVTALTDYDTEFYDRFEESWSDYERGEHFLDYCAYEETNKRFQCVPPRYSSYTFKNKNYRLSDDDAITLLMEKCNYYPEALFISISAYTSRCWNNALMRQFLSKVVRLKLYYDFYVKGATETEQLLKTLLSSPSPTLFSLDLVSYYTERQSDNDYSDDCFVSDDHVRILAQLSGSPTATPASLSSDLRTLRELSVCGWFTTDGFNQLAMVINSQPALSSFSFHSSLGLFISREDQRTDYGNLPIQYKSSSSTQRFVKALGSLVQNPNLRDITLCNVTFPLKIIQDLITAFFTLPCTVPQTLKLKSVIVEESTDALAHESAQQKLAVSESALLYKSLEISVQGLESSNFFTWLLSLHPIRLKSLAVLCTEKQFPRSSVKHVDCLPIVAQNTYFQVENLSLCVPDSISIAGVQALLLKDTLKKLKLVFCSGTVDFGGLAEGLQMSSKMLDELKIEERMTQLIAARSDDSTLASFCDTIFAIPQLDHLNLELSLNFNHNFPGIIKAMYKSWKKNSEGRKPKKLVLRYSMFMHMPGDEYPSMASEMGLHLDPY